MTNKNNTRTQINFRLSLNDKEFIEQKTKENGYKTVSAFLIDCAKNQTVINLDTSDFRECAKQIQAIGYNVNTLIRDIRIGQYFTENDYQRLIGYLDNIESILKKERKNIDNIEVPGKKLSHEKMIKLLEKNNEEIPLQLVYNNLFDEVKNMLDSVRNLAVQEGYGEQANFKIFGFINTYLNFDYFDKKRLVKFSNELYPLVLKLNNRGINTKRPLEEKEFNVVYEILLKYIRNQD